MIPLSKRLLEYFRCDEKNAEELQQELNEQLSKICKPCWELKYCPYGVLVEDFPLLPMTKMDHRESMKYLRDCLKTGKMGDDHDILMDDWRRKLIEEDVYNDDENIYVEKISKFEKEASCKVFGHLCPVFFVNESETETSNTRNRSRKISNPKIIRIARRDNNTCQICGRNLLDSEIEIDHIIPFSRGGTSDESNLRVTCLSCNRKKGYRTEM